MAHPEDTDVGGRVPCGWKPSQMAFSVLRDLQCPKHLGKSKTLSCILPSAGK